MSVLSSLPVNQWDQPGSAAACAAKAGLSKKALARIKPDGTILSAATDLIAAGLANDAMLLAAAALGTREAVWWALSCIRTIPELGEGQAAHALKIVDQWVQQPSEDLRRSAMTAADTAGSSTPAGCLAMAVFLSDGSIGPPNVQVIPPPAGLANFMAGNSVVLAAISHQAELADQRYTAFLKLAEAVAKSEHRWGRAEPAAPPVNRPPSMPAAREFPPYPRPKR